MKGRVCIDTFEGPLELLLALVQREELDICGLFLREVVEQYREGALEEGAKFVALLATLLLLKSRALLPMPARSAGERGGSLSLSSIPLLVDYCRFKRAAEQLALQEELAVRTHVRGEVPRGEVEKPLGIEHISLDELATLFQEAIARVPAPPERVEGEVWRLCDAIARLKLLLEGGGSLPLLPLLRRASCREELIVFFLACLELMKGGVMALVRCEGEIALKAKGGAAQ